MTIDEAAQILSRMYGQALASREQALSIHLFAIKYADQITNMSLPELAIRAGIPKTYATELRKGINLSKHVQLKS